jgi:seryl-tRNA synthetase
MKEKLIAILKTLGLYSDDKKAEIEKALDELEKSEGKPKAGDQKSAAGDQRPESGVQALPKEVLDQLAVLAEQNKQLFAALAEEKKAREEANKAIAEKMKADQKKRIDEFIEKNKARIPPSDVEEVRRNLEKDFEAFSKLIEKLPEDPAMKKDQKDNKSPKSAEGVPPGATLALGGTKSIRDQIEKLTTISDN